MRLSSPVSFLQRRFWFGNRFRWGAATSYSVSLAALCIALVLSSLLQRNGPLGIYCPILGAVILCAWYVGTGPALVCQASGALLAFSFLVRPRPDSPVSLTQLYGVLGFVVVGKIGVLLAAYMRSLGDLKATAGRFELLANSTNDAFWDWDLSSGRISLTGHLYLLLQHSGRFLETTAQWWRDLRHPGGGGSAFEDLALVLESSAEHWTREYRIERADRSEVIVAVRGTVLRDRAGKPVRMIGGLSDVTSLRAARERLAFEAMHDPVTGLHNRRWSRDRLEEMIAALPDPGSAVAVLFLDLDRFKNVNDSFGHATGDKLLRAVSKRVELSLRGGEAAARFGGDEFTILIPKVPALSAAVQAADRIQEALATPFELESHTVVISASIGIALARVGSRAEDALRHADVAMYRAKARGRATSEVFESGLDAPRMNLVQLESEIRKGIAEREFVLHYQPIVSLHSGELIGVEALVRWHHPRRGLLPPLEFVPVAEESGLIRKLGAWVLETACADIRSWELAQPAAAGIYVNVNVAEKQFLDEEFPALVKSCLLRNGLNGSRLVLELTENITVGDSANAASRMEILRRVGVRFALDDFGKGHSSLARLHELPISILKIDSAFIQAIAEGRPELADAIVALGSQLRLEVTAECVESPIVAEHLRRNGCTAAQGNYFGPPMSGEALLDLLRTQKRWRLSSGHRAGG